MKSSFAKVLLGLTMAGGAAGVGFGASTAISSAATPTPTTTPGSSPSHSSPTTPSSGNPCPHMRGSSGSATGQAAAL
jgi:hypothetical protein